MKENGNIHYNHEASTLCEALGINEPTAIMIKTFVAKGQALYHPCFTKVIEFVEVNMNLSISEWTFAVFLASTRLIQQNDN